MTSRSELGYDDYTDRNGVSWKLGLAVISIAAAAAAAVVVVVVVG